MNKYVLVFFMTVIFAGAFSQDVEKNKALAQQYYNTGNFEKAAILYEELYDSEKNNYTYYTYLFNSLLKLNEYDKLEKIVKKQIKKQPDQNQYLIDLGFVYSQNNEAAKGAKLYQEAIDKLTPNENEIRNLAYKFISYRLNDYLVQTYEQGNKLFKDDTKFAYDLGDAFLKLNQPALAVANWLTVLDKNPNQMFRIQSSFSRNLNLEGFEEALEAELYKKIQEKPNNSQYPELLIWLFTNQKDFENALIQAKALDKKQKEDGYRILQLSANALNEKDYDAAISGYNYILSKGEDFRFYSNAKAQILKARKLKVIEENKYTVEDLNLLKADFENYIATYGKTAANSEAVLDLANLEANYLGNLDKGISLLEDLIDQIGLEKQKKNQIKLALGDIYILSGDVWEAVLLYEQVNKDEKDSPVGEDARFRSARLSYYNGDFEWAQAQLTVLKGATTELIANDALNLSLFIIDNLGLDTTTEAMEMYADAELLVIQNKDIEALAELDAIIKKYPNHALLDDILFQKAKINFKMKKYSEAEKQLLSLLSSFNEDILADNATFMLAELYETKLQDATKAQEYYEKIILDYSDSVLMVEARKRYRKLRGDNL